ncbi:hypothetical protein ACR820_02575 [Streptomyces netropsis]
MTALDYVIRPALEQGHHVALHAPHMFRREARRRRVEFHNAGTNWTCEPVVQQTASEIWKESGNVSFNRHVFGHLWPAQTEAKARDLLAAWTRARPDLVIAECSDLGAHLAARSRSTCRARTPGSRSSSMSRSPHSCAAPTCS